MSFLTGARDSAPARPPSPPEPRPNVLPILGPMRQRHQRMLEEAREREVAAAITENRQRGVNHGARGLGYGSAHASYFAYTRGAPARGVYTQNAVEGEESETRDSTLPLTTPSGQPDSKAYAAQRIRHQDPILVPAPQALGYGRRHAYYPQYLAPIINLDENDTSSKSQVKQ